MMVVFLEELCGRYRKRKIRRQPSDAESLSRDVVGRLPRTGTTDGPRVRPPREPMAGSSPRCGSMAQEAGGPEGRRRGRPKRHGPRHHRGRRERRPARRPEAEESEVWAYDLVLDLTHHGRAARMLTASPRSRRVPGNRRQAAAVTREEVPQELPGVHDAGRAEHIRGQRAELRKAAPAGWMASVEALASSGSPPDDGYCESFDGSCGTVPGPRVSTRS